MPLEIGRCPDDFYENDYLKIASDQKVSVEDAPTGTAWLLAERHWICEFFPDSNPTTKYTLATYHYNIKVYINIQPIKIHQFK